MVFAYASARAECFSTCMSECDADHFTCRRECQQICSPIMPALCRPGQQTCFGISWPHHRCCPSDARCCIHHEWPSLRTLISCCPPGSECCARGGCYDSRLQQCTPGGVVDCPTGTAPCNGQCCPPGQACTDAGCVPAELACMGRRCSPGEVCTPHGCCAPDRVTAQGCCPRDRILCDAKCCAPGETCKLTTAGGFCINELT